MISIVPMEYLPFVWDDAEAHLRRFEKYSSGDYDVEEIWNEIQKGHQQLWIYVNDESEMIGAWTTRVFETPSKKLVEVFAVGGSNILTRENTREVMSMVEEFGKKNGCSVVQISGRRGWKKVLAPLGYEEKSIVIEKEIGHG